MIRRLLNTSVFRLSLVYALLFSGIAAFAMMSLYWVAEAQLQQQSDARLKLENGLLMQRYYTGAVEALEQTIAARNADEGTSIYLYALIPRHEFDVQNTSMNVESLNADRTQMFVTTRLGQLVSFIPAQQREAQVRLLLTYLPGGYQLLVGTDLGEQYQLLRRLQSAIAWAIGVIVTLSLLGGTLMGYKMLQRIEGVTHTANEIMQGDFTHRMPVSHGADEFDRLGRTLNHMLERIEQLMQSMREVTNNLAHDLRNPLNRLRHRLEVAQLESANAQQYREVLGDAVQDVDGLIGTFNALLSIAQLESDNKEHSREYLDINAILDDLAETYQIVAEDAGLQWHYQVEPGLQVWGERQLLAQLLINLLDNAVKYTSAQPLGGAVSLIARQVDRHLEIIVSDNGAGIPAKEREQVFKRFYRLESARSTPGNGLGLSLVKAIVDWHDAEISLEDAKPQGLLVRLSWPASDKAI